MSSRQLSCGLGLLLLGLSRLSAAFVGDYDESRWTVNAYGGDGAVDWLGDSCLMDSGFSGTGNSAQLDLVVRASRSGTFYFSWAFYGGTSVGYRLARIRNSTVNTLVGRRDYDEGTASFVASAGDLIGFRINAPIDEFPAMAEISGFFAPGQEPVILVPPTATVACYGEQAIFSVIASNAVDYQWQFKGQDITEENAEDLVVRAIPPADAGSYRVVVRNPLGSVTSQAVALTILQPPVISVPLPSAISTCAGQPVTLSIAATGTNPRYQWFHGDQSLAGATNPFLTLPVATSADAGEYRVMVSNRCTAVISGPVVLSVLNPPIIIAEPASQSRYPGESVTFAPLLAGPGPFQYQWRREGSPLPYATSLALTLPSVQPADAGAYTVDIANACGLTTSVPATLTISSEPMGIRIVRGQGRDVSIEVMATIGRAYALEVSTDATHWTAVQTNWLVLAGSPLFRDVADRSLRFYRIRPVD